MPRIRPARNQRKVRREILRIYVAKLDNRLTSCKRKLRIVGQRRPRRNLEHHISNNAFVWASPGITQSTTKQAAEHSVLRRGG